MHHFEIFLKVKNTLFVQVIPLETPPRGDPAYAPADDNLL